MHKETEDILIQRQILLDNVDGLYSTYKKKDTDQLSLFGTTTEPDIELKLKSGINVNELLIKEKESLGLCISYNKLLRYQLIRSKLCNTTIGDVFLSKKDTKKLKFIGELIEIKHMTAKSSGNKYAKLLFEDETGNYEFYLFGKNYKNDLQNIFLNKVYLVMVNYNSNRNSASVSMITDAEAFNIGKFISNIYIESNDFQKMIKLKPYVFANMIGNDYNLYYIFNGKTIKASHKINITKFIVEDLINNEYNIIAK